MSNLRCLGLMGGLICVSVAACANPAAETYQKGVEGGEKAIDNARSVQQTVDQTKSNLEQQEKAVEGGTPSP
ncbi:MAG: hypothetical protein WCD18_02010 [Thermosynechococcaceae cyanobacterium]